MIVEFSLPASGKLTVKYEAFNFCENASGTSGVNPEIEYKS